MDLVRTLVSLGRSAREEANIKVRQPVKDILVYGADKNIIGDLTGLVKEELNVKEVTFPDDLEDYMNFILKLDFKVAGRILGKDVRRAVAALNACNARETIDILERDGEVTLDAPDGEITLKKEWVEIRTEAKKGFNVQKQDDLFVILDTNLDDDLVKEGYVREVISKVQQMRKNNGYEVTDRIDMTISENDVIENAVAAFEDYLKDETLCDEIVFSDNDGKEVKLNDQKVNITLERK